MDSEGSPFRVDAGELFEAYLQCRRTKRKKVSTLEFEIDYEERLFELREQLESGKWTPSPSLAFVVKRPVRREIFAADFRDRVVHHWLMNKMIPLLEDFFSNNSFACRPNRGTHYGISRIYDYMHPGSTSKYNSRLYILKLDISGFFMSINRGLLYNSLSKWLFEHYNGVDLPLVAEVLSKVIFNDPFGNLTSQILANFYLHPLDEFVRNQLGVQEYGRYVDDFVLFHEDPLFLANARVRIQEFLIKELSLELHPHKVYLQHSGHGVPFLGMVIKPGRIYAGRRIKSNFFKRIRSFNEEIRLGSPSPVQKSIFRQTMNSYLGLLNHYNTRRLRKSYLMNKLSGNWLNHFSIRGGFAKVVPLVRPAGKGF